METSVRIARGTEPATRLALRASVRERVGLALLGGPHCLLAVLEEATPIGGTGDDALLLDLPSRHATVALPTFHPDLDDDLRGALAHVLRGLWEAFGWGLAAGADLDGPLACQVRLRRLWQQFGPRLEAAGLPTPSQVAELLPYLQRGFSVDTGADFPELVSRSGAGRASPQALCFAFGAALVHRPDLPALAPPPPLEPAWGSLHEEPQRVAAMLSEINGMSPDENLDNLEAAVEDALRARGIRLDVWARFREVDPDTREAIVHDVRQMFRGAGML